MTIGEIILADSATKFFDQHRGQVVICGSHGGVYCGYLAARAGLRAVILNDAGIGLDQAGIACLAYGDNISMAVATCRHDTARIGDAQDMATRGVIGHVNRIAQDLGCRPGQRVVEAAELLRKAPHLDWAMPAYAEARVVIDGNVGKPGVVCLDSVSLVTEDDIGRIVLTGSHGGLMGGRPELALKVDALAAFFNDAGIGIDEAGLARLPALDQRGIPAATVDAMSARIGDGRSTYEDGVISRVNECARSAGIVEGMAAKDAVERLFFLGSDAETLG